MEQIRPKNNVVLTS